MHRSKKNKLESFDGKMTMVALLIAAQRNNPRAWTNLAKHLAVVDRSGQATSDTLSRLEKHGQASDAEQLATILIAPDKGVKVAPTAREAACRWAGRTERWSMLALASENETPETASDQRTIAVERLFAEALTQTGRAKEASVWWNHLVDARRLVDFGTLLRCAETETSVGEVSTVAQKRIAAARETAGDNPFQLALVDLLDAELSIRRTEFDQARSLLERVVRSNETDSSLRGRAQWLIGETHYLQRSFTEAIEAYRRVEGIDKSGSWTAAALVQAGKSFEQLGRTREATVCYGHLLSRFADSSHAKVASQRLAAIEPANNPKSNRTSSEDISSQPTIRR
jgi:tetratricopeptide (TPR) repeat protein